MNDVALIEQNGAAGAPGQPQVTGGPQVHPPAPGSSSSHRQASIDFQPGGGSGKPVLRLGSTTLGYEDLLIIVGMINLVATSVKVYAEVRS